MSAAKDAFENSVSRAFEGATFTSKGHLIYYGTGFLLFLIVTSRIHVHYRYPCITASDIKSREDSLEQVFFLTLSARDRPPYARRSKLQELRFRKISLNIRARDIVIGSLELQKTWWAIYEQYIGVLPPILCKVLAWNEDAEILKLDMLAFIGEPEIPQDAHCPLPDADAFPE
ncbi:hypothetical protein WG66_013335 [Moniliophthora roreri]|uniref:Uncharacterized protein n=1 Tax=Moniliophthora roreri TaxID=221103 RepID=A0A0W0EXC5_MONRR|nr:hypothetical protein WG66_013335 [Moniliophthora roreri]